MKKTKKICRGTPGDAFKRVENALSKLGKASELFRIVDVQDDGLQAMMNGALLVRSPSGKRVGIYIDLRCPRSVIARVGAVTAQLPWLDIFDDPILINPDEREIAINENALASYAKMIESELEEFGYSCGEYLAEEVVH